MFSLLYSNCHFQFTHFWCNRHSSPLLCRCLQKLKMSAIFKFSQFRVIMKLLLLSQVNISRDLKLLSDSDFDFDSLPRYFGIIYVSYCLLMSCHMSSILYFVSRFDFRDDSRHLSYQSNYFYLERGLNVSRSRWKYSRIRSTSQVNVYVEN